MKTTIKKYKGFSLVEMLLTIGILGIITLLVASTLTTLIKVSMVSNAKSQARNDVNFITELMQRSLGNSNVGDISMYNSSTVRFFDRENMVIVEEPGGVGTTYQNPTLLANIESNEIHVRSYGYDVWSCIGYFKDYDAERRDTYGYLLKTSRFSMGDHSECFSPTVDDSYISVLHSYEVNISDFNVEYLVVGDDNDNMFIINTVAQPIFWPQSFKVPVNRDITRQTTVSTQGLTWY